MRRNPALRSPTLDDRAVSISTMGVIREDLPFSPSSAHPTGRRASTIHTFHKLPLPGLLSGHTSSARPFPPSITQIYRLPPTPHKAKGVHNPHLSQLTRYGSSPRAYMSSPPFPLLLPPRYCRAKGVRNPHPSRFSPIGRLFEKARQCTT